MCSYSQLWILLGLNLFFCGFKSYINSICEILLCMCSFADWSLLLWCTVVPGFCLPQCSQTSSKLFWFLWDSKLEVAGEARHIPSGDGVLPEMSLHMVWALLSTVAHWFNSIHLICRPPYNVTHCFVLLDHLFSEANE